MAGSSIFSDGGSAPLNQEVLRPLNHPEFVEVLEHGKTLPPPENFIRRTRISQDQRPSNPRIESFSSRGCTTKQIVSLSMDDVILEALMDAGKFAHDEPIINCCLLRIIEVPIWEKSSYLKKEGALNDNSSE
jgi:hypothetical protein